MPDIKYVKIESKHFSKSDDNQDDNKYWTRSERHKWLIALFIGCAMAYSTRIVMPLSITKISGELNWNKKDQGTILASFFWGYALTQILGGYLSDRIGGEIVLLLGAVGWSLVTFWTPLLFYVLYGNSALVPLDPTTTAAAAHSLGYVAFSRIVCGAFQGIHFPSLTSLLSKNVHSSDRAISYSITVCGSQFGMMISGVLGSYLLGTYRWTSLFYTMGLLSMAWVIIMRYTIVESFQRKKKRRIISMASNTTNSSYHEVVPWATLLKHKAFWVVMFGHLCHTNSFFILVSWIPTYFSDNFPDEKGWIGNLVPYLITIPCSVGGGWLADRLIAQGHSVIFVRKLMETCSMFGTAASLLTLCLTSSYTAALFCLCMALGCCALHNSGISVNVQDIAPQFSGSVFGMMNTAGSIPGFVGVYLVGYILETTGQWSIVFSQTALLCVVGGVLFLMFGTGKPIV